MNMKWVTPLLLSVWLCLPAVTSATEWVDWKGAGNVAFGAGAVVNTVVSGTVGSPAITVTMIHPMSVPALSSQFGGALDTDYWLGREIYLVPGETNTPPTDLIRVNANGTYTLTFSSPVKDPVMAIVSLGGGGCPGTPLCSTSWDFGGQPVKVLKVGAGAFGNGPLVVNVSVSPGLNQVVLTGTEGHGLVQFTGTMTSLTWSASTAENWAGFTIGIPSVSTNPTPTPIPAPVPTPVPTPALTTGTITLAWDIAVATEAMPIDVTRLYRGFGVACDAVQPLPAQLTSIPYPGGTFTDATIPLTPVQRVCYEATHVNTVGESDRSNRTVSFIGTSLPSAPLRLRVTP